MTVYTNRPMGNGGEMADEPIDTEKLRGLVEMATQMDGDCSGSVVAADIVLAQAGGCLDELDHLRAENQRLRLEALTAESQALEIEQQLRAEVARLNAANGHLQQELAMRPER